MSFFIKKRFKSKVLLKYIASYVGIIALTCSIVGVALFYVTSTNLENIYNESATATAETVAKDLDEQIMYIHTLGLALSNYEQVKLLENKYTGYEIVELVELLSEYNFYVPYSDEFFLTIKGAEKIYTSNKSSTLISAFLSGLNLETTLNYSDFINELSEVNGFEIITLDNDNFIFAYVIPFNNSNIILGLHVKSSQILNRAELISGSNSEEFNLSYNGVSLINSLQDENETVNFSYNLCNVTFPVMFSAQLEQYSEMALFVIIILMIFLFLIGVLLAKANYNPIKKLIKNLNIETNNTNSLDDEFKSLQYTITKGFASAREKNNLLARQIFYRMINGDTSNLLRRYLVTANIPIIDRSFCVLVINWNENMEQHTKENCCLLIEDLRLKEEYVLTYTDRIGTTYILITSNNSSQISVISQMVEELLQLQSVEYSCKISSVKNDIIELQEAVFEITYIDEFDEKFNSKLYYQLLNELKQFIAKGEKDLAQAKFCEITEFLKSPENKNLNFKGVFAEITIVINNICQFHGINIKTSEINYMLSRNSIAVFSKNIYEFIGRVCDSLSKKKNNVQSEYFSDILLFIDNNFTDNSISLDVISGKYNIGISLLSLKFKEETGMNYKEYVTNKRIELAKELLRNKDIPVNEICGQVGYVNTSHFISTFKKITGLTPLAYKKGNSY